MSVATLYRWSGIVLLVGGLLGVIGSILDAVLPNETAQQILSTSFTIDASLFLAWALLVAMGLPGLYLRQATRAGGRSLCYRPVHHLSVPGTVGPKTAPIRRGRAGFRVFAVDSRAGPAADHREHPAGDCHSACSRLPTLDWHTPYCRWSPVSRLDSGPFCYHQSR
jgi:hypothetical protein